MNHVRNIKEMLSIQCGSRNVATSGYSSLTDSQLFFGSQFWPENSQNTSQDLSLSSRNSQQSSQEGSDPKSLNTYHSKPLLFGDLKDKTKTSGLLGKFEEDRKKAKEKKDNDLLAKELQQIRETLVSIQQLVTGTDTNTALCQTVFEKMDAFASILNRSLTGLQSDISLKFESLVDKLNTQKQVMAELEERVQKNGETTVELDSNLQSLRSNLQCLREEQERDRHMLQEAVRLLTNLVSEQSAKPTTEAVRDSSIQTSPGWEQSMSILPHNRLVGTYLKATSCSSNQPQAKRTSQDHRRELGRRKLILKGQRGCKKRPLVLPQRSKCTVLDENSNPGNNLNKPQSLSSPLLEHCDGDPAASSLTSLNRGSRSSQAGGCIITPLSCWSQDSSGSECLTAVEPILEKLVAKSNMETAVKLGGLWQLFDCES
ncbi:interactor of HORMAD1 protein 1 isoform 2-T2 [Menidia menidia]